MEDGGRKTEDEGRRTEHGARSTEHGARRKEDGGRRTKDGGEKTRREEGGRKLPAHSVEMSHYQCLFEIELIFMSLFLKR